jgi:hypothetical protein
VGTLYLCGALLCVLLLYAGVAMSAPAPAPSPSSAPSAPKAGTAAPPPAASKKGGAAGASAAAPPPAAPKKNGSPFAVVKVKDRTGGNVTEKISINTVKNVTDVIAGDRSAEDKTPADSRGTDRAPRACASQPCANDGMCVEDGDGPSDWHCECVGNGTFGGAKCDEPKDSDADCTDYCANGGLCTCCMPTGPLPLYSFALTIRSPLCRARCSPHRRNSVECGDVS